MAHFIASINVFEHEGEELTISCKVYRVYEFGAAPSRPVWHTYVSTLRPGASQPAPWLRAALEGLLAELQAR